MNKKLCTNCAFCFLVDYGYSNYTVEGTHVFCGVKAHPQAPFDRWYGEDKRLLYAAQCSKYMEGKPVEVDVDRIDFEYEKLTVAQHIMWKIYVGKPDGFDFLTDCQAKLEEFKPD